MDNLRVEHWNDFVGQTHLKERLRIHIDAARREKRRLDHILLASPPGYGKTALASIIANEMNQGLNRFTMPLEEKSMRRALEAASYENRVLMLDEVHRLPPKQQEMLLPVLEFGEFHQRSGRFVACDITVVAATTEPQKLIAPLADRFPIRPDFDEYTDEEMGQIVEFMCKRAKVRLDEESMIRLGKATGGTPRRARQFVLAARDLLAIHQTLPSVEDVLGLCRIDEKGLSFQHQQYLRVLGTVGGTAGVKTLQNLLSLSEAGVRDLERLLIKQRLLLYTERGRELTSEGYRKAKDYERRAIAGSP